MQRSCRLYRVCRDPAEGSITQLYMAKAAQSCSVDCHFLLQGIFPTQGSTLYLLHCRRILNCGAAGEQLNVLSDIIVSMLNFVNSMIAFGYVGDVLVLRRYVINYFRGEVSWRL